jgi:hypothetical protein
VPRRLLNRWRLIRGCLSWSLVNQRHLIRGCLSWSLVNRWRLIRGCLSWSLLNRRLLNRGCLSESLLNRRLLHRGCLSESLVNRRRPSQGRLRPGRVSWAGWQQERGHHLAPDRLGVLRTRARRPVRPGGLGGGRRLGSLSATLGLRRVPAGPWRRVTGGLRRNLPTGGRLARRLRWKAVPGRESGLAVIAEPLATGHEQTALRLVGVPHGPI